MADSCWVAGYTGDSIFIGHLDTGCDFTHPALTSKFSGYRRDFVNGLTVPYDDNGHGAFSAGIICGGVDPGQGNCVAPGNYPLVLGSGATDSLDYIVSFSSRISTGYFTLELYIVLV